MDTTKLEAEFLDDLRRFAREAIRLAKENITLRGRIDISYPTRDEGESPESWANRLTTYHHWLATVADQVHKNTLRALAEVDAAHDERVRNDNNEI